MILTNSTVYNYFRDNYGYKNTISEEEINLKERYKNLSRKDLKKESKTLKLNNASINIIKYVAKEIRSRINKNPISIAVVTGNDDETSRNFWGYAKKIFRSGTAVLPSFGVVQGTTNFTNTLKCVNLIPFNLSPPTFQEINELSSAWNPWFTVPVRPGINNLFYAMSILLRSFILNICTEVLRSNTLPTQWTKAATILIHKKGELQTNYPGTSKFKNIYAIASN